MNFKYSETEFLAGKTEILCETIIDALRELRSAASGPVTASLLSRSLINNTSYLDALCSASRLASLEGDSFDAEGYATRLKHFQITLLKTLEAAFGEDWGNCGEELCVLAENKSRIDELFQLNDRILDSIIDGCGKACRRQKQLFELLAEVTRNLLEVEHFLTVSLSNSKRAQSRNADFSETLERDLQYMSRVVDNARNLDELKSLLSAKLESIKQASRKRRELEEKLTLHAAREIEALKSQIKNMRKQVAKAQKHADTMEKVSLLDPLTGVANRRGYQKYIREEWNVYANTREPFSILMIDIDNFKSVNDRYGHWAGDKCLAELAKRIGVNLRGTDFLARYGGEEFIVVLHGTVQAGAVAVAEKLRGCIEQTRFLCRGERIPLTISIGVSTVLDADQSVNAIQDRVDKGLYQAKKSGRNHVSIV